MTDEMNQVWELMYKNGKGNMFPEPLVIRFIKRNFEGVKQLNCRALEVGCGFGAHTLFLAENGIEVSALDVSESSLAFLEKEAKRRKLNNISTFNMPVEQFDLPKDHFDLILDITCLQHIYRDSLLQTLEKLKQSIKPQGWFYSWFISDSKNLNDENFYLSNLTKGDVQKVFQGGFNMTFDEYRYTENDSNGHIAFTIFAAHKEKT